MTVLVSDTSVLIDLERGSFLEHVFRLPFEFAVSDLLYHGILNAQAMTGGLKRIAKHPRCRLPQNEIRGRLRDYSSARPG